MYYYDEICKKANNLFDKGYNCYFPISFKGFFQTKNLEIITNTDFYGQYLDYFSISNGIKLKFKEENNCQLKQFFNSNRLELAFKKKFSQEKENDGSLDKKLEMKFIGSKEDGPNIDKAFPYNYEISLDGNFKFRNNNYISLGFEHNKRDSRLKFSSSINKNHHYFGFHFIMNLIKIYPINFDLMNAHTYTFNDPFDFKGSLVSNGSLTLYCKTPIHIKRNPNLLSYDIDTYINPGFFGTFNLHSKLFDCFCKDIEFQKKLLVAGKLEFKNFYLTGRRIKLGYKLILAPYFEIQQKINENYDIFKTATILPNQNLKVNFSLSYNLRKLFVLSKSNPNIKYGVQIEYKPKKF